MKKYQTSNSLHNSEKLQLLFAVTLTHVFLLIMVGFSVFFKCTTITLNFVLAIWLINVYRKNAFELIFSDENILQNFKFISKTNEFSYSDLISVSYKDWTRSPDDNIFCLKKLNKVYEIKTDVRLSIEDYLQFIKWLKIKNPNFETFVYPKGSTLHMRLRQELLGKEY